MSRFVSSSITFLRISVVGRSISILVVAITSGGVVIVIVAAGIAILAPEAVHDGPHLIGVDGGKRLEELDRPFAEWFWVPLAQEWTARHEQRPKRRTKEDRVSRDLLQGREQFDTHGEGRGLRKVLALKRAQPLAGLQLRSQNMLDCRPHIVVESAREKVATVLAQDLQHADSFNQHRLQPGAFLGGLCAGPGPRAVVTPGGLFDNGRRRRRQ